MKANTTCQEPASSGFANHRPGPADSRRQIDLVGGHPIRPLSEADQTGAEDHGLAR